MEKKSPLKIFESDWVSFLSITFKTDKSYLLQPVEPVANRSKLPTGARGNTRHCNVSCRLTKLLPNPVRSKVKTPFLQEKPSVPFVALLLLQRLATTLISLASAIIYKLAVTSVVLKCGMPHSLFLIGPSIIRLAENDLDRSFSR